MKHSVIASFDEGKGFGFTTTGVFVHMNDGRIPTLQDGRIILGPDPIPKDRYPKRGDSVQFILKRVEGKRNANPWAFAEDVHRLQNGVRASILCGMIERLEASGFPDGQSEWTDGHIQVAIAVHRKRHGR